jgi:hypothetical protein
MDQESLHVLIRRITRSLRSERGGVVRGEDRVQVGAGAEVELTPHEFFEQFVRPSVETWRHDHLNIRLAKHAISELNNMAERVFWHWGPGAPQVYYTSRVGEYRRWLAEQECGDFQLAWDIADAHKHVELTRSGRAVTRDMQTAAGTLGYGEELFGQGIYGSAEQLIVVQDDGTRRAILGVIGRVLQMWEYILRHVARP